MADFRSNHIINGSSPEFRRVLDWFWTAVSNFTVDEMGRLLQFTTGSSQLPPGGFKELSPRFQLTPAPTYGNLPTAHTWYVCRSCRRPVRRTCAREGLGTAKSETEDAPTPSTTDVTVPFCSLSALPYTKIIATKL